MKKNVLVFPCGSEIGLEIYKSLSFSTHFNVIGGSSVDDHGAYVYKNYIGDIPWVDSPMFIKHVNKIIEEYKIDFIIPANDTVLVKLSQSESRGQLKCDLITSPVETCELTRSKAKTYEYFKKDLKTPKVYKNLSELSEKDFPVFLKPDIGQGAKGTYLANTEEEAEVYLKKDSSLMLVEYLPGREYTVDCFSNSRGELIFCEGRERQRIVNGISVKTKTINNSRFELIAKVINQKLNFRGVWFFQVKENLSGDLVLMEIAPRVAGAMALIRNKGVNLVLLSLFDAMGIKVEIIENDYDIVLDRALQNSYLIDIKYSHVYLDLDDLIILGSKVNTSVIAFIYQCINNDKKIHLLTRHRQSIDVTLDKYHLTGLFNEIISIPEDGTKDTYIKSKDSIFIDDSFSERKTVHEKLNIPVFDSHMIESLMEKT